MKPVLERLWEKVDVTPGCWEWTGARIRSGHGSIYDGPGRTKLVHRIAYEDANGELPRGARLVHSCGNRICVNPAHLKVSARHDWTTEDFWACYEVVDLGHATPCWRFGGALNPGGYGHAPQVVGSTTRLAHRLFFERFVGPVPDGLVLDHLCRVRSCVNPQHLEPVTIGENVRRGTRWARA